MSNKNVRVKIRALVLLDEIMDQDNANIRPGRLKGKQEQLKIDLPVMEIPEDDWAVRIAAAQNVLEHGNVVAAAVPPYGLAEAPEDVSDTEATLKGHVQPQGLATTTTFQYGTTKDLGTEVAPTDNPVSAATELTVVSKALSGLTANTTYYFRLKCVSATKTTYSLIRSFKTDPTPAV